MRPTRDIPLKTGAKGITFAPCPETLWLIECCQFLTRRALAFEFGEFAQNLNVIRANYPTSGELSVRIGSDKKSNSLILRARQKSVGKHLEYRISYNRSEKLEVPLTESGSNQRAPGSGWKQNSIST